MLLSTNTPNSLPCRINLFEKEIKWDEAERREKERVLIVSFDGGSACSEAGVIYTSTQRPIVTFSGFHVLFDVIMLVL